MNCWQIIYNASPSGISGASGFGVRTATEGIPKEILDRVGRDTALMSYACGTFNVGNVQRVLFDSPDRIYEWPRRYFYKEIPLNADKVIYVLGRAVYAGFDHSFYSTKTMCRPGNFIVHVFVFEQKPDKSAFSLLQENVGLGMSSFYPADYRPSWENHQMLYLMTGKPEYLPKEDFSPQKWNDAICPEAFDLFFEYRQAVLAGKPFAVKMPAAKAPEACAGLMRLLPPSVASDTTFEINHQTQGLSVGAKITVVNEYYQFVLSPLTCHLVDYNIGHMPSRLEEKYRERLEKTVAEGDDALAGRLAEWIWSDIAVSNMDASKELNLALFNYCHDQNKFKADDLRNISGLLQTLSGWIGRDRDKAALLTARLTAEFETAASAEEFEAAVSLCEKVRSAGLDVSRVVDSARKCLTSYAVDRPSFFARLLENFGLSLVKVYVDQPECKGRTYILYDYSMREWWSRTFMLFWDEPYDAKAILSRMLELHIDDAQIKEVLSSVLPSSDARVKLYISMLKENTSILPALMPLLQWDQSASDKVDYMTEFQLFHDSSAFAPLFFRQLVVNLSRDEKVADVIRQYSYMCSRNTSFAVLLFREGAGVYSKLLESVKRSKPKAQDYQKWAELIKAHVLDVLPDSVPAKKDWEVLWSVLLSERPKGDVRRYYRLAVELDAADAVSIVASDMFDYFLSEDDIRSFTSVLLNLRVMDVDKILARARTSGNDSLKGLYAAAVLKSEDYQEIKSVAEKLGVADVKTFVKTYFPEVYKAERRKEMVGAVKGFFTGLFAKEEAQTEKQRSTMKKK